MNTSDRFIVAGYIKLP